MEEKRETLIPLKDILYELFNCSELPFNPRDGKIWEVWDEVVGPGISRYAQPAMVRKGCLSVDVSEPIWLQELKFLEEDIRAKLNIRLGRQAIEKIEFRLGNG